MFVEGLPFKVKEKVVSERDFHQRSLQQTISDARMYHNANNYLNKGRGGGE